MPHLPLLALVLPLAACAALACSDGAQQAAPPSGDSSGGSGSGAAPATGGSQANSGGSQSSGGSQDDGGATSSGGSQNDGGSRSNGGSTSTGPVTCRTSGDDQTTITFVNQCSEPLSFRGSDIDGGDLAPGEHACRHIGSAVEPISAVRYWGFIGQDPGGERHTLAELTLNSDFNDFDWYNISHVDAHNLPMRIVPVDHEDCRTLTCAESLLENCPAEGQLLGDDGKLISCFSPDRDDPESVVAQYFEASCDDAYSWSGDDSESMAACAGEDYDVVFCP